MFDYTDAGTVLSVFTAENVIALVIMAVVNMFFMNYLGRKFMQIIQQSGYVYADYIKWVRRRDNIYVTRIDMVVMLSVLAYLIYSIALSFLPAAVISATAFVFYVLFMALYIRSDFRRKSKCPLVFTTRLMRIYITYSLLFFVFSMLLLVGCTMLGYLIKGNDILLRVRYCLLCLSPLLVEVFVPLANAINAPMERANNRKYVEKCKKKLAEHPDLIKIGITGSYGKTSVKEILKTVLSEKYNVLATPLSYNTPLGICKTVKKLNDSHDVFIAEMGARHEGDIKELCDIVKPDNGIINGVIEHHMETFLSLSQIKKTKSELIRGVKDGGTVVLTTDNEHTLSMLDDCKNVNAVLAGVNTAPNPYVYATDIKVGGYGSTFTLHIGDKTVACSTVLLGEHNVSNILLAAALCDKLGLSPEEIAAGVARVRPVAHRLEVVRNANGVTVIDDSYNSNVNGTKAAIEVFGGFEGRKIIITPGMVELGRVEDHENFELGKRLAGKVDVAILVGVHAYPIRDGLLSMDQPIGSIHMAKDLDDAVDYYKTISASGDVVLFENDLPDKFS